MTTSNCKISRPEINYNAVLDETGSKSTHATPFSRPRRCRVVFAKALYLRSKR